MTVSTTVRLAPLCEPRYRLFPPSRDHLLTPPGNWRGFYVQDERYAAGAGMRTTAGMQEVEPRRSSCRGAACVRSAQRLMRSGVCQFCTPFHRANGAPQAQEINTPPTKLPNLNPVLRCQIQRISLSNIKHLVKLRYIPNHSIYPVLSGRMRIGVDLLPERFIT